MVQVIYRVKDSKWTGSPRNLHKEVVSKDKKVGDLEEQLDPTFYGGHIYHGWYFDCCCGAHGANYDDVKRSIQCDICKIWMHCKCNKVPTKEAELQKHFENRNVWVCPNCREGKYKYRGILWNQPEETKEPGTKITFSDNISTSDSTEIKQTSDLSKSPAKSILKPERAFSNGMELPIPSNITERSKMKKGVPLKRLASQVKQFYVEEIMASDSGPQLNRQSSALSMPQRKISTAGSSARVKMPKKTKSKSRLGDSAAAPEGGEAKTSHLSAFSRSISVPVKVKSKRFHF